MVPKRRLGHSTHPRTQWSSRREWCSRYTRLRRRPARHSSTSRPNRYQACAATARGYLVGWSRAASTVARPCGHTKRAGLLGDGSLGGIAGRGYHGRNDATWSPRVEHMGSERWVVQLIRKRANTGPTWISSSSVLHRRPTKSRATRPERSRHSWNRGKRGAYVANLTRH